MPRPPRPTLFPYTTLFRSEQDEARAPRRDLHVRRRFGEQAAALREDRGVDRQYAKAPADVKIDRKSTRLNSSHGSISYAVFCLKKKTRRSPARDRCWQRG